MDWGSVVTWLAIRSFLKSPLALWIGVGLLIVAALAFVYTSGVKAGDVARAAKDKPFIEGLQSDLKQCRSNTKELEGSVAAQNAAVSRLQDETTRRTAEATKALVAAQKGRASAEARAASLLAKPPSGVDSCARMFDADDAVLRALK